MTTPCAPPGGNQKRACGPCSLCCFFFEVVEFKKGQEWCRYCRPGRGGCTIYEIRPKACRDFACEWLRNPHLPDEWYPQQSHMVMSYIPAGHLGVHVHPDHLGQWRQQPYFDQLTKISAELLRQQRLLVIFETTRRYILLEREIIAEPLKICWRDGGVVVKTSDGNLWQWVHEEVS